MRSGRMIREDEPRFRSYILWDSRVKGLGMKVNTTGRRPLSSTTGRMGDSVGATIGRPSEISLADAWRRTATELDAIRNSGSDPTSRAT